LAKLKFGLRIPTFPVDNSPSTDFVKQILNFTGELEQDFDSAWVDDHFHPWANFVPNTTPVLESFTTISHLSGRFKNLSYGNIVLCNSYRNPALLAKMGATLQALTGGRFTLGIGAGWKQDEYVAYGYEFPKPKVRIEQLEESVQIIRKMWTEEMVTFKGKHFKITNAFCNPKPEPIPQIMIGGGGEKLTLRVVARHADWWNLANVSPRTYQQKSEILEKHCGKIGRNPDTIVKILGNIVAIAETHQEAKELASKSGFINVATEENLIVGNPNEVISKLSDYVEVGVEDFILRFVDFPKIDGAKLFFRKVIPSLTTKV